MTPASRGSATRRRRRRSRSVCRSTASARSSRSSRRGRSTSTRSRGSGRARSSSTCRCRPACRIEPRHLRRRRRPAGRDPARSPGRVVGGLRAVILNEREALHLSGRSETREAARELAARGCLVVVTRGGTRRGRGARPTAGSPRRPGLPVVALDTVGAGDLFTAAFIWADLADRPLEECLDGGHGLCLALARRAGVAPEGAHASGVPRCRPRADRPGAGCWRFEDDRLTAAPRSRSAGDRHRPPRDRDPRHAGACPPLGGGSHGRRRPADHLAAAISAARRGFGRRRRPAARRASARLEPGRHGSGSAPAGGSSRPGDQRRRDHGHDQRLLSRTRPASSRSTSSRPRPPSRRSSPGVDVKIDLQKIGDDDYYTKLLLAPRQRQRPGRVPLRRQLDRRAGRRQLHRAARRLRQPVGRLEPVPGRRQERRDLQGQRLGDPVRPRHALALLPQGRPPEGRPAGRLAAGQRPGHPRRGDRGEERQRGRTSCRTRCTPVLPARAERPTTPSSRCCGRTAASSRTRAASGSATARRRRRSWPTTRRRTHGLSPKEILTSTKPWTAMREKLGNGGLALLFEGGWVYGGWASADKAATETERRLRPPSDRDRRTVLHDRRPGHLLVHQPRRARTSRAPGSSSRP